MSLEKLLNIPKELNSSPNTSIYNLVKKYYFDDWDKAYLKGDWKNLVLKIKEIVLG